jgi:hypothetical protein
MEKVTIYGVILYTSDELKDNLKKIVEREASPNVRNILIDLINSDILIPIINEPNKIKQFINKLRRKRPLTTIIGTLKNGKCYVIVSHNVPNSYIINTSVHEGIHLGKMQFPKEFTTINMSVYINFYSYLYKKYFEADSYNKEFFAQFIKRVTKVSKRNIVYYSTYDNILKKSFLKHTSLDKDTFNKRVDSIVDYIDKAYSDPGFRARSKDHLLLNFLLKKTYRKLFKNIFPSRSVVGQEIWYPDEIIAILSTIKPDHPNVIKSLKLIKPGKAPVIKSMTKKIVK